jgi:hypothetical protein
MTLERTRRSPSEDQQGGYDDVREHAADDDSGGQAHIAGPPHGIAEQIQHADGYGPAERRVRIGERGRQHLALASHPAKHERRAKQHRRREQCCESESQDECVMHESIGAITPPGAERTGNGRRNAAAHAAVRRVHDQHHPGERQRHARQRICAEAAEEQAVKGDHAGERQQVQHVRCRDAQQCGKDRPFKQQPRLRRSRTGR